MTAAYPSSLKAILGPTNTGKTFFAIERMLAHRSGMIGLPLRLLAREVYHKVVDRIGAQHVALVTGEERIVPAKARYWVCTVEAMPLDVPVECVAIDEIQVATAPSTGVDQVRILDPLTGAFIDGYDAFAALTGGISLAGV